MPRGLIKNFFGAVWSSLMLALILVSANAAAAPVDPDASLPGIPQAGYQSFTFNDSQNGFGNNVQSWFANYLIARKSGNMYNMYAHSEGSFRFWTAPGSFMQGNSGSFDLVADFDLSGNLLGGMIMISGAVPGLGLNSTEMLMTANLIADGFAFDGDLLGFRMEMTYCASQIVCTNVPESTYFNIDGNFPGIAELAGSTYRTTMAVKSTVPIPAAAWLMLSGLLLLGIRAKRTAC